ncbi:hypothetical protein MW887_006725 [Aspergillus wentii]|nr:hypothetical protein MW887_006725 [Aspergillus wentii]
MPFSFFRGSIGKPVHFSDAGIWTLTEKLDEENTQLSEEDYEIFKDAGGLGAAYGTFLATKTHDSSTETALIRAFLQVPHAGSSFMTPEERADQAVDRIARLARMEIDALMHSSILKQDQTGLIPGGFLVFLLIERLPGVRLDTCFWDYDRSERDAIRSAFRTAWEESVRAGIINESVGLEHPLWDRGHQKVYFTAFQSWCLAEPIDVWWDIFWIMWGLAEKPRGYRLSEETERFPDKTSWKL